MPAPNPQCYHLSASSISAFKQCPQQFRLKYREGIRTDRDTDSQRQGTNWHAMHETYANALTNEHWGKDFALEAVIKLLNERYAQVPGWLTPDEWALERQVLLTSFVGYLWYWQNDPVEFLASEIPFDLPVHMPRSGMPLSMNDARRVGKIDHVVKWQGAVCALERKSTTRTIAADSDYWDKSKKDTQVSMYALAFRDMLTPGKEFDGKLGTADWCPSFKLATDTTRYGNTLYDVWHKPTIKPKMLTQAETAAFIESKEFCGQTFDVRLIPDANSVAYRVNETECAVEQGKKGFAIRETIEMFGARLLADIYERPDFYFARREIVRTDAEITEFQGELYAIYQAQKAFSKGNFWFSNEAQCRATRACDYIPICYGPGATAVCDGKTTPNGFRRIFVDLTVNGAEVEA